MTVENLIKELERVEDKSRTIVAYQCDRRSNDEKHGEVREVASSGDSQTVVRLYINQ